MMIRIVVYVFSVLCTLNGENEQNRPPVNFFQPNYQNDLDEIKSAIEILKTTLQEQMTNEFSALRRNINASNNQLLDALVANQPSYASYNQPRITLNNVDMFPGTNDDFMALLPVLSRTSKCNNCSTCRKNGICIMKTYEVLTNILNKYPDWTPPSEIPARPQLNELLKNALTNISENVDNTDLVYLVWGTDRKLRHLIDPLFLASLKLPAKGKNGKLNPALFIALSQGNINPLTMMALMGDDFDPMLLALTGNVDPMTLAMMKNKNIDPLLLTLLSRKENQNTAQGGCGGAQNKSVGGCNKLPQRSRGLGNSAFGDFDPNLALLLSKNGNNSDLPMALMLMNMMKGNNARSNNTFASSVNQPTTNGYGKLEEAAKADGEQVASAYGRGYGR